jgi:peptidoglycan/xylan/chitin deacetylase (PgdA/CDA1 family)
MIAAIQNFVRVTDAVVARAYLALFRERNALLSFLFHSLFRDEAEMELNLVDPLERTMVRHFREFIEYYLENGYRFVGPDELLEGLDPSGKYALITFDDGYYNNMLALPVLEEYGVPAVVFVSTNHVCEQKNFWWDVLYRERTAQGATPRQIYNEAMHLKVLRSCELEAVLVERFGPSAFIPHGDIDRPFRPDELRALAGHPLVHLGNHTADHAILTNYTPEQAHDQIVRAQEALREMTGISPSVIAYPNGAHSRPILQACGELGLKLGFTVRPEKNPLPLGLHPNGLLRLGRFAPLGNGQIARQCRTYRSDLQLYSTFRAGYLCLLRSHPAR